MTARPRRPGPRPPTPPPSLFTRSVQKITRDLALFVLGFAIIINEVWFREGPERSQILILATGLVGLPLILRADERKRNGKV